eukprot:TRINITY_DN19381_c0_g1_i1.p1 TRINITY_DN19381_c0_g1~~TRINITY_DN19381_c0_g1_i1.p1  ORF type:complete len:673 (-),score=148.02 TRINITY_DN19381_c0_g1_i1:62-2056(-)
MEVDADACLDGFLSSRADVRQRANDALQRQERSAPGSLATALAARLGSASAPTEARSLAAVLLRRVLKRQRSALCSPSGWKPAGLGDVLLSALAAAAASTADPTLRRHVADTLATLASCYFSASESTSWPAFTQLLASWCEGGSPEQRAAILVVLEQLRDEASASEATLIAAFRLLLVELAGNGALRALLEATFASADSAEASSRDAAARLCGHCIAESDGSLHLCMRELAPALAHAASAAAAAAPALPQQGSGEQAAAEASVASAATEAEAAGSSSASAPAEATGEALFQAVALAARADPETWGHLATSLPQLSRNLAAVLADAGRESELRSAALAALMELLGSIVDEQQCITSQLAPAGPRAELGMLVAAQVVALLGEVPGDEGTETWAEEADGGDDAADGEGGGACAEEDEETSADGCEALLEAVLDAAGRLVACGGTVAEGLHVAVGELLSRQTWQASHGALLLSLRLAAHAGGGSAGSDDMAAGLVEESLRRAATCLGHGHPRTRWAALEVWARLLALGALDQARALGGESRLDASVFEALLRVAGTDEPYVRVRRRALLVLVLLANQAVSPFSLANVEPLFRQVLLPHVQSHDVAVRDACASIAHGLLSMLGGQLTPEVAQLWQEFQVAASASEAGENFASLEGGELSPVIEWPADWR